MFYGPPLSVLEMESIIYDLYDEMIQAKSEGDYMTCHLIAQEITDVQEEIEQQTCDKFCHPLSKIDPPQSDDSPRGGREK